MSNEQLNSAIDSRLNDLKKEFFASRNQRQRSLRRFETGLEKHWGIPLDLLELQVTACIDAGTAFAGEYRDQAMHTGNYVFQALCNLHIRACQTSREILVLLRSGFADGALARWRTLHEAAVIATVIRKSGNEVANKYLRHGVVYLYNALKVVRDFLLNSGQEFIPDCEYDNTKLLFEQYICKFGSHFKRDYGWANVGSTSYASNFYELEKLADSDYLRYYYKLASQHIHLNVHENCYWEGKNLQIRPSEFGLATPGLLTAHSIGEVTSTFLKAFPSREWAVTGLALMDLAEETRASFQEVGRELGE